MKRVRSCVGPRVGSVRMDGVHCLSSGVHRGRRKEFLLPFLLSCILLLSTGTRADQFDDFTYTSDGTNVTITGYSGIGGDVAIPASIAGLPVTSIGDRAFFGCSSLTSVTIPDSVTSIGPLAFSGCSSLTAINVHAANPNYSSVDGVLFDKNQTTLIQCPGGKPDSYRITGP